MRKNRPGARPLLPTFQRNQIVSIDDKINFIKQEIRKNVLHTDSHFDDTTQINFSNKDGLKTLSHETEITLEGQKMATLTELVINENDELDLYVTALNKRNPVSKDIDSYETSIDKYYEILKDRELMQLESPQRLLPPQEDGEELREFKEFFINLPKKYWLYDSNQTQEISTSQYYDCTIAYDDSGKIIIEFTDSSIRLDKKHYKIAIDHNGQLALYYLVGEEGSVNKSVVQEHDKNILIILLTKIKETIESFEERNFEERNYEFTSYSLIENSELKSFGEEINDPIKSDETEVAGGDFYARRAFFASKAATGGVPLPKLPFISTAAKRKTPNHKDTGPRENESPQEIQPVREISQQAHQGIFDTDSSEIQKNTERTLSSQDISKEDEICPVPDLSKPQKDGSTYYRASKIQKKKSTDQSLAPQNLENQTNDQSPSVTTIPFQPSATLSITNVSINLTSRDFRSKPKKSSCFTGMIARCFGGRQGRG